MSKELVISANRHETRVAILEDDQVVEVYHQRENEYSLAGSIHKGRVTRVLPGMQSAFVDIGLDRDAFLYVSDFFEDNEEYDKIVTSVEEKVLKLDRRRPPTRPCRPRRRAVRSGPAGRSRPWPKRRRLRKPRRGPVGRSAARGRRPPVQPRGRRDDDRAGRRPPRTPRAAAGGGKGGRGLPDSKFYSPGDSAPEPDRLRRKRREPSPGLATGRGARARIFWCCPANRWPSTAAAESESSKRTPPERKPVPSEGRRRADAAGTGDREPRSAAEPAAEPQPELAEVADEPVDEIGRNRRRGRGGAGSGQEPAAGRRSRSAETAEDVEPEPDDAAEAGDRPARTGRPRRKACRGRGRVGSGERRRGGIAEAAGSASRKKAPSRPAFPPASPPLCASRGRAIQHRVSRRMRRRGRPGRPRRRPRRPRPIADPAPERRSPKPHAAPRSRARRNRAEQRTAAARVPSRATRKERATPSISDLLKEGQEIIVQIAKEPLGQKGARITSHIALPGRFLVYMPTVDHIGVSRKIPSDEERSRLKRILQANRTGIPGGFIVRTAGDGRTEEELRADMHVPLQPVARYAAEGRAQARAAAASTTISTWWSACCATSSPPTSRPSGWITKRSTRACCASCSASSRRWSAA